MKYCMNTSTIKGQKLSLAEEISIIAEAGYSGIEPWVSEIDTFTEETGTLKELDAMFRDNGLEVPNLIGFFEWIVDDEELRTKGLDEARRNFEMAAALGCTKVASPPFGIKAGDSLDLLVAAERYRDLCLYGREYGVVPMLEFWGMSPVLHRTGQASLIVTEAACEEACILADVFHIYKGGGKHDSLGMLPEGMLGLLHMNDYPFEPGIDTITDADRVYPGDGIAPWEQIKADLEKTAFKGMLSLELFNETYWAQDPAEVAKTGLDKMMELFGE